MEKNVLRFYISVDDIAIVHEFNGMADLSHHSSDFFLRKSALFSQGWVDITSAAGLKDEVKVVLVAEEGV